MGDFICSVKNGADSFNHSAQSCTDTLLAEANRCVSCGLCLPYCPTYRLTMSEADSPRGRIALMSGVASGNLPMNERFVQHMDRCLTCRACEAVCPNNVAYGQLIDAARAMIVASSPNNLRNGSARTKKPWLRRWLEREFVTKPFRIDRMRAFFRLFQKTGYQQWLQQSSLLKKTKPAKLAAQVPPAIINPYISDNTTETAGGWQVVYPAADKPCGEVGLFLGCVSRLADVETLNSSIYVLNRLGYTVYVPSTQTCCGALHQHSGEVTEAAILAWQNRKAFGELNVSKIITTASGCGVQLTECGALTAQRCHENEMVEQDNSPDFSSRIVDVSKFLVAADGWDDVEIRPLASKIAVHEPCSLRNGLRDQAYVYMLLAHIPGVELVPLAANDQCCGAAGTYFIDQPDFAMRLQAEKISAVNNSDIRYLVTSNIGCSLHIASGLRAAGSPVEVLHPVTLLARQMGIQ